jgi:stage IV sporulation protein FB
MAGVRLGTYGGIRLAVHPLYLAALALAFRLGFGMEALVIVGSLLLHELAHVLTAWALGLRVEELSLTPFGGMARLEGALEHDPQTEATVALAGPCQSIFLAGLAVFLAGSDFWDQRLLRFCFEANANLAFFNLIPALPLDGGRALRGVIAQRFGYRRASRWLSWTGRICGLGMAAVALFVFSSLGRLYLTPLLGGIFIGWNAGREVSEATYRSYRQFLFKRRRLAERRVMSGGQLVAVAGTPLGEVMAHLALRRYHLVLVVDEGMEPLGLLTESDLMAGFEHQGPMLPVERLLDL